MKHNGKYYLLMISMDWSIPGRVRREVCYRADKITGPYEKKVILEHDFDGYGGVGQGCIIDSEEGDWYGVIFRSPLPYPVFPSPQYPVPCGRRAWLHQTPEQTRTCAQRR